MPAGGFLIADNNNQRVRQVASDGTITTAAGSGPTGGANGAYGGDGGPADQALLNRPKSVAATPEGFLIADESNNRIRFVDLSVPSSQGPSLLSLVLVKSRLRARRGGTTRLRFNISAEAQILLEVRHAGKLLAARQRQAGPGLNTIVLGRRLTGRLTAGRRYQLLVSAAGTGGQQAEALAKLQIRRSR
jgi:hypothetical protein